MPQDYQERMSNYKYNKMKTIVLYSLKLKQRNNGRISGLGEKLLTLMEAIVLGYSSFVVIPPANELRATSENPLEWVKGWLLAIVF